MFCLHLTLYFNHNILHIVVYDDPKFGIVCLSNRRGHPCKSTVLPTDTTIRSQIDQLRQDLSFAENTKLVLLISFASDEMIRETMKYPEDWFMDTVACMNKQIREFFFSAIRKPNGRCHLSNFTIIPSGMFSLQSLFHITMI